MKPVIAISMGDYNGIGPEVVIKTLRERDNTQFTPLILGHEKVFRYYKNKLGIELDIQQIDHPDERVLLESSTNFSPIPLLNCTGETPLTLNAGTLSRDAGKASMLAVERGINLCMEQQAHALVTAPISKEAIQLAGYDFPGHTEFLAEKTNEPDFMMMMVSNQLRIGLATVHVPLADVCQYISRDSLVQLLRLFDKSLKEDFGIRDPKIAVLGLNPHAGDGGVIGSEEQQIISPSVQEATSEYFIQVEGPFAADGFFGNKMHKNYNGILAMYHDQGLIPFKTLTFGSGVNFTAGLPMIRTSPDHGTAFEIAGKNKASQDSFKSALQLAIDLAHNKFNNQV